MLDIGTLFGTIELDDRLSSGLDLAQQKLDGFGQRFATLGPQLSSIGKSLTVGVTLPLIGIGTAAVVMATQFNASMANVATLIPGNIDRVNELKTAVQEMAVATGKSTGDLADGLYQVISAFGDTADTVKIVDINARAAAAGLASTTEAIELTSAVTKGYGDTTAAAVQKAADLAFATVKLGQTTFPELAGAIGKVTPIAAALNVTQEELFASFATLTGVTGSAREVTTQMRGAMAALLKPTDDMQKALKTLGVESAAASIEQDGLVGSIQKVIGTTDGSTEAIGKLFANVESLPAIFALSGGQADVFSTKLAAMSEASGSAAEAFVEQTEGVNKAGFAWAQLQQKIVVIGQKLGDILLPILLDVVKAVEPMLNGVLRLVEGFGKLPLPIQLTGFALLGLLAAAGPVLWAIGGIGSGVKTLTPLLGLLIKGFTSSTTAATINTGALIANAAAVGTVSKAVKFAAGEQLAFNFMAASGSQMLLPLSGNINKVAAAATPAATKVGLLSRAGTALGSLFSRGFGASIATNALRTLGVAATGVSLPISATILAITGVGAALLKWTAVGDLAKHALNGVKSIVILARDEMKDLAVVAKDEVTKGLTAIKDVARETGSTLKAVFVTGFKDAGKAVGDFVRTLADIPSELTFTEMGLIGINSALALMKGHVLAGVDAWRTFFLITGTINSVQLGRVQSFVGSVGLLAGAPIDSVGPATLFDQAATVKPLPIPTNLGEITDELNKQVAASIVLNENAKSAAEQMSEIVQSKFDELSGKKVAEEIKLLDTVVRQLTAIGPLTTIQLKQIGKELIDLQESGAKLTPVLNSVLAAFYRMPANATLVASSAKNLTSIFAALGPAVDITQTKIARAMSKWASLVAPAKELGKALGMIPGWTGLSTSASELNKIEMELETSVAQRTMTSIGFAKREIEQWALTTKAAYGQSGKHAEAYYASVDRMAKVKRDSLVEQLKIDLADESLNILSDSFVRLGQIAGENIGGIASAIGQMIVQLGTARSLTRQIGGSETNLNRTAEEGGPREIGGRFGSLSVLMSKDASAAQKAAAGMQAAAVIYQGAINVWEAASEAGSKSAGAFQGAMAGAQAGAAFGPWGIAIGSVVGAVTGFIRAMSAGRREVEKFAESFDTAAAGSGFDELRQKLNDLGDEGERLWINLTQRTGRGDKEGAKKAIDAITLALEKQEKAVESLKADVEQYGLAWSDIEDPMLRMQAAADGAQPIVDSFMRMRDAGFSASSITRGMATDVNAWLAATLDAGGKIPPAMGPILTTLIESKQLTEDNAAALLGLAEVGVPSLQEVEDAAGRYGIKLDELGPKVKQLQIDEIAAQIVKDFDILSRASDDLGVIFGDLGPALEDSGVEDAILSMAQRIQGLVTDALTMGLTLPSNLEPIIDKLIDAGGLTDEFGEKLVDTSRLDFKTPLVDAIDALILKIGDLIEEFKLIGLTQIKPVIIPYTYRQIGEGIPPTGTAQPREPVVGDAPEPDAAAPAPDGNGSSGSGTRTTNNTIEIIAWDGDSVDQWLDSGGATKLTRSILPEIPEELERWGAGV